MRCCDHDLRAAALTGLITPEQLDPLLAFLANRASNTSNGPPKFDFVHMLWYAGALIVIGAMGLFSTLAFSKMGGAALTATALVYAVLFATTGHYLWNARNLPAAGGLLIAIAVSMAPLAVFGIQDALGMWSRFGHPGTTGEFYQLIRGSWIFMEIATILAAAVALHFYRFPFIVLLVAIAFWFMSMDIVPWIAGKASGNWELSRQVSIVFGLAMIVIAAIVNTRQRSGDFAFWLYLFGVLTFWGAITATSGGTTVQKAIYCAMNVGFLLLAVFLRRRVFVVFGTIGVALYLGELAQNVFKDSLLFPFALSVIGVLIIALGLSYHRHQQAIASWLDAKLPAALRRLRPASTI
ncbi:MAG: hypothetical protein FWD68_11785 [Alphaproteobacteria bacterium]|nr:hypothetical protein [Alphaproteobacteria bacterium]